MKKCQMMRMTVQILMSISYMQRQVSILLVWCQHQILELLQTSTPFKTPMRKQKWRDSKLVAEVILEFSNKHSTLNKTSFSHLTRWTMKTTMKISITKEITTMMISIKTIITMSTALQGCNCMKDHRTWKWWTRQVLPRCKAKSQQLLLLEVIHTRSTIGIQT